VHAHGELPGPEERHLHAADNGGHVDEVDGDVNEIGGGGRTIDRRGARRPARRLGLGAEIGVRQHGTPPAGALNLTRARIGGHAEDLKIVVHG